jgi:hypothetical protein
MTLASAQMKVRTNLASVQLRFRRSILMERGYYQSVSHLMNWKGRESTRWFKYDRDYLCVNKSQFVPVIFEPPCIRL